MVVLVPLLALGLATLVTIELPALLLLLLVVVWSPEVFLLPGLSSGPAALRVLRRRRVGAPGGGRWSLVVVAARLRLLLHSRISLQLLLVSIPPTTTGPRKSLRLRLRLSSKLLLLKQQVRWRRCKEGNSLLEGWRELSSVTEGWWTAEGILRHSVTSQ